MTSDSVGQPAGPERKVKNPRCSDFQASTRDNKEQVGGVRSSLDTCRNVAR